MKNIIKIFDRLTEVHVKLRTLPVLLAVQNVILALIVLIIANVIISKGQTNGELDYMLIKLFYNLVIMLLFLIVSVFAPYFLAGTLNKLVKNNTVEYLLSSRVTVPEITFAVFLRGFLSVLVLLSSAFPIACISFYFGGVGIARFLRMILCLLCYAMLLSTLSLFISSMIFESNLVKILSYTISLFLLFAHLLVLDKLINSNVVVVCYSIVVVIFSLAFLAYSNKGQVLYLEAN